MHHPLQFLLSQLLDDMRTVVLCARDLLVCIGHILGIPLLFPVRSYLLMCIFTCWCSGTDHALLDPSLLVIDIKVTVVTEALICMCVATVLLFAPTLFGLSFA